MRRQCYIRGCTSHDPEMSSWSRTPAVRTGGCWTITVQSLHDIVCPHLLWRHMGGSPELGHTWFWFRSWGPQDSQISHIWQHLRFLGRLTFALRFYVCYDWKYLWLRALNARENSDNVRYQNFENPLSDGRKKWKSIPARFWSQIRSKPEKSGHRQFLRKSHSK